MRYTSPIMEVFLLNHALGKSLLGALRNKESNSVLFRSVAKALTNLLLFEATRRLPLTSIEIETPLEKCEGFHLKEPIFLPILRAGLGLLEPALELFPNAKVGMIGMQRNERTAIASEYYSKLPSMTHRHVFILEPMLATGGTSQGVLASVFEKKPAKVYFISIVAAPEGINLLSKFDNLELHVAAIDRELNENKFILPGLGDFGDRLYGT